jgi:hypothetical protein
MILRQIVTITRDAMPAWAVILILLALLALIGLIVGGGFVPVGGEAVFVR